MLLIVFHKLDCQWDCILHRCRLEQVCEKIIRASLAAEYEDRIPYALIQPRLKNRKEYKGNSYFSLTCITNYKNYIPVLVFVVLKFIVYHIVLYLDY